METIRLTVKRTKPVDNTDQYLRVDLPQKDGNLDAIATVELEAYNFSGTAGAVPADVVLEMTGIGTNDSGYISHVITDGSGNTTHIRHDKAYLPLVPPGGLATRDHTTQSLVFRSPLASPMNLTNSELRVLQFDATSQRYVPWNDWTNARFQLILMGYIRQQTYAHRK
jgi:hypothetical protein